MQVTDKTVVSIRYRMKNSKGEILENIMDSAPIHYMHGSGSILPSLEANLAGLKIGEEKTVSISKEQGFSGIDDDFILEVIVDGIRLATEEELIAGSLLKPTDNEECGPGCFC